MRGYGGRFNEEAGTCREMQGDAGSSTKMQGDGGATPLHFTPLQLPLNPGFYPSRFHRNRFRASAYSPCTSAAAGRRVGMQAATGSCREGQGAVGRCGEMQGPAEAEGCSDL